MSYVKYWHSNKISVSAVTPPSPQGAVQCASLVAVQGRQSAVIHTRTTQTAPHHNNTTTTLQDSGLVDKVEW